MASDSMHIYHMCHDSLICDTTHAYNTRPAASPMQYEKNKLLVRVCVAVFITANYGDIYDCQLRQYLLLPIGQCVSVLPIEHVINTAVLK